MGSCPVVSSQGYRYYIAFVDAFSWFTWVYFLKNKSEAFQAFLQFKAFVELQLGHRIKSVQSEFHVFTKFCQDNDIAHRIICPHTHHQNGIVEQKHRHLTEVRLTLLAQACMPLKFWDDAMATATHIINQIPPSSLQSTSPFECLFHKKPDYSAFKVFSCACYPFLCPYNKHKF